MKTFARGASGRCRLLLRVDGKRLSFSESVFYAFHDGYIAEVWSVIDNAAIEAQL